MALPGMAPPMPDDGAPPSDVAPPAASPYAKAGRTIRHAIADGDDEALGQAICDLVDIHGASDGGDDADGAEAPKKPNLALILASKGKK